MSRTVVGTGEYEPEHNAVPVVERPHEKESGKQEMRPCLKHNNMQKQNMPDQRGYRRHPRNTNI